MRTPYHRNLPVIDVGYSAAMADRSFPAQT